jgi:16S rRNA (guanine966-N2)-methyltransferase
MPWLAPQAWLYVEAPPEAGVELPEGWAQHREGRTRDVRFALYRRQPAAAVTLSESPASGMPSPQTIE